LGISEEEIEYEENDKFIHVRSDKKPEINLVLHAVNTDFISVQSEFPQMIQTSF